MDDQVVDEDGYYKKVYMTEHGEKYHKNPICFHIKVNAIPMVLNSLPKKSPCRHCVGDFELSETMMVFTTLASPVYHSSPSCYSIYHNILILSEKESIYEGYQPCGTCSK